MPESMQLTDWTLLSLRPKNQHSAIRRAAKRWHAKTVQLSAFKLVSLDNTESVYAALACDIRIASSPAAVRYAKTIADIDGDWLAIGNTTAQYLLRAGACSVQTPEIQNADGLLALDSLKHINNVRVGVLTAPNGRGELERILIARGALLQVAHVYSRQPLVLTKRQLAKIDALTNNTALLVTSQKAFEHIWGQLNASRQAKFKTFICVTSSTRLVEYLHTLGITRIICSPSTLPNQQIRALANAIASKLGVTDV